MFYPSGGNLSVSVSRWSNVVSGRVESDTVYWTPRVNFLAYHDGTEWTFATPGQLLLHLNPAVHKAYTVHTVAVLCDPDTGVPMLGSMQWDNSQLGVSGAATASMSEDHAQTDRPVNPVPLVFRNGTRAITVPAGQAWEIVTIMCNV